MNIALNLINGCKSNLNSLLVIPIILVGCIYINYGEVFESVFKQQNIITSFFELKTHLAIFSNDFEQELLGSLPKAVTVIGFYSIIFIYILFMFWLAICTISNYIKLSNGHGLKIFMLLELIATLIIFILFINTGLNLWLKLIVYMVITFGFFQIIVYWLFDLKKV